jgi:hypothetical protein
MKRNSAIEQTGSSAARLLAIVDRLHAERERALINLDRIAMKRNQLRVTRSKLHREALRE